MRKGERTKLHILKVTIELAYNEGLENINFNQLAKLCDLSQPAFYKYFKNKNDLIYNCLAHVAQHGREVIDSRIDINCSADRKLEQYLTGNLFWAKSFPQNTYILMSMYIFAHQNEDIKKVFNLVTETGIERIKSILLAGEREKLWEVKNPTHLASIIQNALIGEIFKRFNNPKLRTPNSDFVSMVKNLL